MFRNIMIMAMCAFIVFGLGNVAFATCPSDTWVCVDDVYADPMPDPLLEYSHTDVCDPAPAEVCPLQAFSSTSMCVSWLNDDGTWANNVQGSSTTPGCWQGEPMGGGGSPYEATDFTYPMIGEGGSSGNTEWSCAIRTDGSLSCFGTGGIDAVPTGGEPYSALSSGSTGRFGVLDSTGQIRIWGNNTGGTFGSSLPTTTGFTELGVGRDVGCVVGISGGGVTCWGDNTQSLVTNASKPSSGTYTAVEVGRYVAGAVQDDGTLDMWGNTSFSTVPSFISNRPTGSDIVSWETGESGQLIGVAWHTDGTVSVWQPNAVGIQDQLSNAPGWDDYGSTTLRLYKPQGPDGEITFRSRPEIVAVSGTNTNSICGVIDDPKGLYNGASTPVAYEHGDAICWPYTTNGYPMVEAKCASSM